MKVNNCHQCKHRRNIPGSAHIACGLLGDSLALLIAAKMAAGIVVQFQQDGVDLIEFNPVGIRGGWCLWPVNFDPTWVTCHLPVNPNTDEQ